MYRYTQEELREIEELQEVIDQERKRQNLVAEDTKGDVYVRLRKALAKSLWVNSDRVEIGRRDAMKLVEFLMNS